jgi:uncharacterized protein
MITFLMSILCLPRNIVILMLFMYRLLFSRLYGDVCRYYPSCSAYALRAVQVHGLISGSVLFIKRITRCHPWAKGGVDDVPPTHKQKSRIMSLGFVVPIRSGKG